MPLSERDFPKEFIKNKLATFRLTIKLSIYEKQKHPFVHLLASCLKMGRATIALHQYHYQPSFCFKDIWVKN